MAWRMSRSRCAASGIRRGQDHGRSALFGVDELDGALAVPARMVPRVQGRAVLLVDDVMASGATLAAAARACQAAGSGPISVVVLARAVKDA